MPAYPDTTRPAQYTPCPQHDDTFDAECVACVWSTVLGLVHHVNVLRANLDRLRLEVGSAQQAVRA